MNVEIFLNKSVDENASLYYEKAKKSKKKLDGINTAIRIAKENRDKTIDHIQKVTEKQSEVKVKRKKDWYENYRWFFTSSGKLVIGGRDASTNESVIKKHLDAKDIVFHTEMAGSPFMILKIDSEVSDFDLEEVGQFTASFSRAWKKGLSSSEVFYVNSDQVSKTAKPGEFMGKGSFMIYGKRTFLSPVLKIAVGFVNGRIECSVPSAIKSRTNKFVELVQGNEKTSDVAKKIKSLIGGEIDEIVRVLPAGGLRISKGSKK